MGLTFFLFLSESDYIILFFDTGSATDRTLHDNMSHHIFRRNNFLNALSGFTPSYDIIELDISARFMSKASVLDLVQD